MKTASIFTAGLVFISAGLVASCALETSTGGEEPVARVGLNIARVPADVSCVVVDVVTSTALRDERSFSVTPGTSWATYLEGLPTGIVTFQGFAYAVSCAERDANVPNWAASAKAILAEGVPSNVVLAFHPNTLPRTPVDPGTCVAEACAAPTDMMCGTGVAQSSSCTTGFAAVAHCVLGTKGATCDASCACEALKCTPGQASCAGAANVLADFVIPEGTCTARPCAPPNGSAVCAPAEVESAACAEGTVAVPRCTLGPKGTTCDASCACEPATP